MLRNAIRGCSVQPIAVLRRYTLLALQGGGVKFPENALRNHYSSDVTFATVWHIFNLSQFIIDEAV